jgi:hypothetical protein
MNRRKNFLTTDNQPFLALLCCSWLLSNENEEEKQQARRIEESDCYQFFAKGRDD